MQGCVILRIRFHNSYSLKWTNSLREFRGMYHQPRTCGGVCDFLRKFRETLNPSGAKSKAVFPAVLNTLSSRQNRKRYDSTLNTPFARVWINYSNLFISLVLKTIDSQTGTCYSLLPFKGRCILNLLKTILLRSMKTQTEISYVCIHRDSKIKYQHTLFENRSPVYPLRDIDPILYPSILLSHLRVMITNIKKDIKNKGFNDLIDEATHILASLGLNKQIVEVAVGKIIDDVIDNEDKQESLFDALYMHDCVESALVRFETFGSKFSGDIAKAISKSFNSDTLSEGQIRANGV